MYKCIHCDSEINYGARLCPYCHLQPCNPWASEPYPPPIPAGDGDGVDPMTVGLLGSLLLPVFPVVGGVLLGTSIVYGIWKWATQ
jgi:hypothetical protein